MAKKTIDAPEIHSPAPRTVIRAKTQIMHGVLLDPGPDGEPRSKRVTYEMDAELPFDPRDPAQAEANGCGGLQEGVHFYVGF